MLPILICSFSLALLKLSAALPLTIIDNQIKFEPSPNGCSNLNIKILEDILILLKSFVSQDNFHFVQPDEKIEVLTLLKQYLEKSSQHNEGDERTELKELSKTDNIVCAPQTHQLALDMQLSIFGWLVVLLTKSEGMLSKALIPSVHLVSAYLRYSTVRDHRLSMIAYHGVTVSQVYRTAFLSYMSILHRCSPYLIGLSLGHALRNPGRHGKIFLTFGWMVWSVLCGLVLWAGHDAGSVDYKYNISFAAQYAALAPLASSMALAWLIYVVHAGHIGFLSRILASRPLLIISRLSYAIYLIQFVVFFTNAATIKTSSEFTLLAMIDAQEISMLLLSAVILTLTFITPMQSLYRESPIESQEDDQGDESKENQESNGQEPEAEPEPEPEPEPESKIEEEEEVEIASPTRRQFVAHRELLEEIPEAEVEYEAQRDSNEGLEEILEEEENESLQEELEDDLEIIEEEQEPEPGGEEDYSVDRRDYLPRRSYSRNSDRDLDDWDLAANGRSQNTAQHYRYGR